ncbi:portal protein [Acinetobacter junii]|uniref:portal protein n=1 Tax=Acinetobacter junii TaxID=40215 RepID=UPI0021CDE3F1|nr:portal protein [Acinetobacter junii]MCU4406692.1 head-tail connector protein [Acinetobacter junii]
MNEDAIKKLKKRFDVVWQNRVNDMDEYCAEIALHVLPVAIKTIKNLEKHDRSAWRKIVDNTGKDSLKVLAAGMLSGTCSPSRPWFVIEASDPQLKKDMQVKKWLKELQDICYATFAKSNVYRTIHNCYLQEGAFGTCAALAPRSSDAQLMDLIPMSFGEYAITVDSFNKPNGVYRKFKLTVENMIAFFGEENVSDTVKQAFDNDNLDQEFTVHHAIYQRVGAKGFGAKNMPYASVYFEPSTQNKLLRESGLESFEVICGRWTVSSSDIYGESPSSDCFGDMRAIQKGHQQIAKGVDYQVSPPVLIPDYLKGQEKETLPNGIAYYTPNPSSQTAQVQPMLNVQFDVNGVAAMVAQAQERVRRAFYTDLFLMLDQYDQGKMTATEVYERKAEKMLMLGPVVERQIDELLRPLVEICVNRVLADSEYLRTTAPEAIQNSEIKIEFVSILALAQRATGASNLERMLAMVGNVAQVDAQVLDKFDTDKFLDEYAEIIGASPTIFRDPKEVAQIRSNRAQQQQIAQQQALMQQQAATQNQQANAMRTVSEIDPQTINDMAIEGGFADV